LLKTQDFPSQMFCLLKNDFFLKIQQYSVEDWILDDLKIDRGELLKMLIPTFCHFLTMVLYAMEHDPRAYSASDSSLWLGLLLPVCPYDSAYSPHPKDSPGGRILPRATHSGTKFPHSNSGLNITPIWSVRLCTCKGASLKLTTSMLHSCAHKSPCWVSLFFEFWSC
jgi:hypothetical protein